MTEWTPDNPGIGDVDSIHQWGWTLEDGAHRLTESIERARIARAESGMHNEYDVPLEAQFDRLTTLCAAAATVATAAHVYGWTVAEIAEQSARAHATIDAAQTVAADNPDPVARRRARDDVADATAHLIELAYRRQAADDAFTAALTTMRR